MHKITCFNPFLPLDKYIPDGEPHVFNNRIYLYGSHDKERGDSFCLLDYEIFSASIDDLSNWTSHGVAYHFKEDPYFKEGYSGYAPDCIKGKDGRYYLYYCLAGYKGSEGYNQPISVAVSDYPDRDFHFYGHVKDHSGNIFIGKYINFDPALINDNGIIRLYFGAYYPWEIYRFPRFIIDKITFKMFKSKDIKMGAFNCNLKDDMLTIDSEIFETITQEQERGEFKEHPFFEASSIRKIKDTYYFIYSSWHNHELCYATSKYPNKDYHFQGRIISNGDVGIDNRTIKNPAFPLGNNHGSIECINGQYYVFYHRQTHNTSYSRQACLEKISFDKEGNIIQSRMTTSPLGAILADGIYPAEICSSLYGKKPYYAKNSGFNKKLKNPFINSGIEGVFIDNIYNGTHIVYRSFKFQNKTNLGLEISGKGKGVIDIYINDNIISSISVNLNSNSYQWIGKQIDYKDEAVLTLHYRGKGKLKLRNIRFKKYGQI